MTTNYFVVINLKAPVLDVLWPGKPPYPRSKGVPIPMSESVPTITMPSPLMSLASSVATGEGTDTLTDKAQGTTDRNKGVFMNYNWNIELRRFDKDNRFLSYK